MACGKRGEKSKGKTQTCNARAGREQDTQHPRKLSKREPTPHLLDLLGVTLYTLKYIVLERNSDAYTRDHNTSDTSADQHLVKSNNTFFPQNCRSDRCYKALSYYQIYYYGFPPK